MATTQQIEANRLNAQNSTGPRSIEGKAVSRFNALKTGIDAKSQIIRGEDPAELDTLAAEYQQRWQPATPEQRLLVDTLIDCEWLLRRLRKAEAHLWECKMQELEAWKPKPECLLGDTLPRGCEEFSRLQRRIDSTSRNYHRALKELQRLESQRRDQASEAPPKLASFLTLASEDAEMPPPGAPGAAACQPFPPHPLTRPTPIPT